MQFTKKKFCEKKCRKNDKVINLILAVIKKGSSGEGLVGCMRCILIHLQSISFTIVISFLFWNK